MKPADNVHQELEKLVTSSQIHPIDTLLVQQLETLLSAEAALTTRYSALGPSENSVEVRMAFSKELADLKTQADRLYRLVNAMDNYGPYEPHGAFFSPAAA